MKRSALYLIVAGMILALESFSYATVQPPRNPDSAKECAMCHFRWVDTFFLDGRGSDLVDYQSEKVAATAEMCFSCHDGSVVDSRSRVYNDRRHKTDRPPPSDMQIPELFPLDEEGKMQCFTCHTAHSVSSEMGMEKTIFIRASNDNSKMCTLCHADKDGGAEKGNHPIGSQEEKIPESLVSHGARTGDQRNHVICETCHTVHGSPNESFLVESARNSGLCLECHSDKQIFTPDGQRNHQHVVNVKPEKVEIPGSVIKSGAKLGYSGEIICQTCHDIHNNNFEKNLLLIMKDAKSSLCLTCHSDKEYVADTKHNLKHSAPDEKNLEGKTVAEAGMCSACHLPHREARKTDTDGDFITRLCLSCHRQGNIAEKVSLSEYRHTLDVNPFKSAGSGGELALGGIQQKQLDLPLFNSYGIQDKDGIITCTTCHDPHKWRSDSLQGEIRKDVKGTIMTSFLRKPAPDICAECHVNKFYVKNSKHDIGKVEPDMVNSLHQTPAESGLCAVCHLVHGSQKGYLWARDIKTSSGSMIQDLCVGCHSKEGMANKKIIEKYSHPVNISPDEKGLTTTLPLFDEEGNVSDKGLMTCETCHDPHRWDPEKTLSGDHFEVEGNGQNSFLRIGNSPSSKLCADCHPVQANVESTDHDLIITAPLATNNAGQTPAESGTCGVCHKTHNSENKLKLWARDFAFGAGIMDKMCNSCHSPNGSANTKIPEVYMHPKDKLITNIGRDKKYENNYFPLFDKKSGKNVTMGDVACPSCHDVHQWDPLLYSKGEGVNVEGTATNSFIRAQTYSLLCIDCHGLEALFRFKYYHDPDERVE
jgi:predicted CXXCH cytochrome family protein